MILRARFDADAAVDVQEAYNFYLARRATLADDFLVRLRECVEKITSAPLRYPVHTHDTRKARLKRFPYSVIYHLRSDEVVIVAVAHAKRGPRYWRDRL